MQTFQDYLIVNGVPVPFEPSTVEQSTLIEGSADQVFYALDTNASGWGVEWKVYGVPIGPDAGFIERDYTVNNQTVRLKVWAIALSPGKHWVSINGSETQWARQVKFEYVRKVSVLSGTISDNGDIGANVAAAKEHGIGDLFRIWAGYDGSGAFQNPNVIGVIKSYRAKGVKVIVTLSPKERQTSVVRPTAAIARIKAECPKDGVIWEGPNEPNLNNYWPGGKWREAFAMWSDCAAELKADGRQVGTCAFSWQGAGDITSWLTEAADRGWLDNVDWIFGHNYPTVRDWVPSAIDNARDVNAAYRGVARAKGKKFGITECGLYGDKSKFAEALPLLFTMMRETTDAWAYYILRETPDSSKWGLHLIDAAGNATALGAAAKQVAQS